MSAPLSSEFQQAVTDSKKLTQKPTSGDLLEMYCLYKQALQDPPFEKAEQPGAFDFKAKAKYKAWKEVAEKCITSEEAQAKYVALIGDMKEKYKYDPDKVPATVGGSS